MEKGYISEADLYTTDEEVLRKIKQNLVKEINLFSTLRCDSVYDKRLKFLFDMMENKVKCENNPQNYDAHVFCKSRIVDPLFKDKEGTKRVSEADAGWKEVLEREMRPKEYFIKFER